MKRSNVFLFVVGVVLAISFFVPYYYSDKDLIKVAITMIEYMDPSLIFLDLENTMNTGVHNKSPSLLMEWLLSVIPIFIGFVLGVVWKNIKANEIACQSN